MSLSKSAQTVLDRLIKCHAKDAFEKPEVLSSIMDKARNCENEPLVPPADIPEGISVIEKVGANGIFCFVAEPVVEPAAKPVTELAAESAAKPTTELATEPEEKPVAQPMAESINDAAAAATTAITTTESAAATAATATSATAAAATTATTTTTTAITAASSTTIVYYHGGGFIMEMGEDHWNQIFDMVEKLNCQVVVPRYKLAPVHTFKDSYASAYDAFCLAKELNPDGVLVLMGGSAGAHLAIAVAQMALERGDKQPDLIVAISPWVDVAFEIEGKEEINPIDPLLDVGGLRTVVDVWAPGSIANPQFPPCILHGPFEGLAPLMVFGGTREIFYPEIKALVEHAQNAGIDVTYIEGKDLWHCWAEAIETNEGRQATNMILDRIQSLF